MPTLKDKLKQKAQEVGKPLEPLWKGPEIDGLTQSMLSTFLCCRERFRIGVIEGLSTPDQFNHRIEYGNMWHICEEWHGKGKNWEGPLREYAVKLIRKYRLSQEQIDLYYNVCRIQFPIYLGWWSQHEDVVNKTSLMHEETFRVPYKLPSGRVVTMRGKWDGVDVIGKGKDAAVYLQENKAQGDPKIGQIKRQMDFDLQTMYYLTALLRSGKIDKPLGGVRYNVIRRPLAGGRGSIRQHKPTKSNPQGETSQEFYDRLAGIISEAHGPEWEQPPGEHFFFMRWKVTVTEQDIQRFEHRFLIPILEQLCDWWGWVTSPEGLKDPFDYGVGYCHWQHPYGVYNVLNEGGSTEMDEYLATGSKLGLERATTLFPELEE